MGFDDLEAAEQDRPDKRDETEETSKPKAETEPERDTYVSASVEASATDSADASTGETTTESTDDSETAESSDEGSDTPAFEYGDVKQSPMYARPEAWNALEDTLDLEVVRSLREAGVRNEEKRELHDAVLRIAADHPEEIAEAVQEAREGDD